MELHNALLCISRQTGVKEVLNGSRFCDVTVVGHSNTFLSHGNRLQNTTRGQTGLSPFSARRNWGTPVCPWFMVVQNPPAASGNFSVSAGAPGMRRVIFRSSATAVRTTRRFRSACRKCVVRITYIHIMHWNYPLAGTILFSVGAD